MNNMKSKYTLAVVGTANTGKTTFIKDLISYYSNNILFHPFSTNSVDYREKIKSEGLEINRNGNLRSQKIIFDCLADSIVSAIKDDSVKNFVSDRSVIDAYVYTVYLRRHNMELEITDDDMSVMFDKLKRLVKLYDEIIYIPLSKCENVDVVDDKFRDTDYDYRKEIDDIFRETLRELDLIANPCLDMKIYGSREDRLVKFISSHQSSLCKKNFENE